MSLVRVAENFLQLAAAKVGVPRSGNFRQSLFRTRPRLAGPECEMRESRVITT
jgi:hypothetical protein